MRGLLLLVLLAGAAAVVVLMVRRASATRTPAPPSPPGDPLRSDAGRSDPRRITVGDVVKYEARDFIVRGTLEFDQDGFRWQEHFLDDLEVRRWLSVEDDEGLEIVLWESLKGVDLQPGSRSLERDGITFTLEEHGRARFAARGTTGTAPSGNVEYYDYASGEDRLSFERYGEGPWEIGRGRVVSEYLLDIYPGS